VRRRRREWLEVKKRQDKVGKVWEEQDKSKNVRRIRIRTRR
jgi:hypothetical protein